jgi:hypothetical protein
MTKKKVKKKKVKKNKVQKKVEKKVPATKLMSSSDLQSLLELVFDRA